VSSIALHVQLVVPREVVELLRAECRDAGADLDALASAIVWQAMEGRVGHRIGRPCAGLRALDGGREPARAPRSRPVLHVVRVDDHHQQRRGA
jgi:hypothetical protein